MQIAFAGQQPLPPLFGGFGRAGGTGGLPDEYPGPLTLAEELASGDELCHARCSKAEPEFVLLSCVDDEPERRVPEKLLETEVTSLALASP